MSCLFPPAVLRASRSQVEPGSRLVDECGEHGPLSFPASVGESILSSIRAEVPTTLRAL